jgi:hypothetical protein
MAPQDDRQHRENERRIADLLDQLKGKLEKEAIPPDCSGEQRFRDFLQNGIEEEIEEEASDEKETKNRQ